jgi:hypothetical protein
MKKHPKKVSLAAITVAMKGAPASGRGSAHHMSIDSTAKYELFHFLFNCGDVEWAVKVIVAHRSDKSVSFMSMLNDAVIGIEQEPLRD